MKTPIPRRLREVTTRRINRAPSPLLATSTPWIVVILGSLLAPLLPIIPPSPIVPPLGFLFLLAWLQLRPGILPPWAGFPLGLLDDLMSGQPMGSAALLWSVSVLLLEFVEFRMPWRNFFQNWIIAAGLIVGYLLLSALFAGNADGPVVFRLIGPQILISVLLMPLISLIASLFDRFRLLPLRNIG